VVLIDHVIYAVDDLVAASTRIESELGLAIAGGGRHEGHGTHNRIVPLGGGYLELLAIADRQEAASSPFGRGLVEHLARHGEGWLVWVVAVGDVDAVARRLGTPITSLRRAGLSARLTGVAAAMAEPVLPFFVSRDRGVADPGAASDAGGITSVELSGDARQLERWLDGASLPVEVVDGPPAVRAVSVGGRRLELG
jgi:hypothetical protein